MEHFLAKGVKDVITDHPEVGKILDEFNVGCTTCGVGTCLLRDVVGIHNLDPNTEADLMFRIEKAIFPDRDVKRPEVRVVNTKPVVQYSPPVQVLVDEHKIIMRWLALIPRVIEHLDIEADMAWGWIRRGVDVIREYADGYHHAKEEDIMFKYADENMEIIQVMFEDHKTGRNHVKSILAAMESRDKEKAATHLLAYKELLTEHIRKEDEILYPWIDRGLTDSQVGRMFSEFQEADAKSPDPQFHIEFVQSLEKILA